MDRRTGFIAGLVIGFLLMLTLAALLAHQLLLNPPPALR